MMLEEIIEAFEFEKSDDSHHINCTVSATNLKGLTLKGGGEEWQM